MINLGQFLNTFLQRKLNSKTEWRKVWAADFLERSNEFNELASKIVVGIAFNTWSKKI